MPLTRIYYECGGCRAHTLVEWNSQPSGIAKTFQNLTEETGEQKKIQNWLKRERTYSELTEESKEEPEQTGQSKDMCMQNCLSLEKAKIYLIRSD